MPLILVELLKKTDFDVKMNEIKSKTPTITDLAAIAALNAVDNKIPDVGNIVKKNYDAKISDIESKYFTTSNYKNIYE